MQTRLAYLLPIRDGHFPVSAFFAAAVGATCAAAPDLARADENARITNYFTGASVFTPQQTSDGNPGMQGGAHGGSFGFYTKQVIAASGQHIDVVAANVNENTTYEPASSLKILPALKLMQNVQAGAVAIHSGNGTEGLYFITPAGSSCPSETTAPEWMGQLLPQMLLNSDNGATKGIARFDGDLGALTSFAHQLGLLSTNMTSYPGCGNNQTTLSNVGILYEGIATGSLLNAATANTLYANMADDGGDVSGVDQMAMQNIINVDAPTLSSSQLQAYRNAFDAHYKAGGGGGGNVTHWAVNGVVTVPTCFASHRSNAAFDRSQSQYIWGAFIDNETTPFPPNLGPDFLDPVQVEPLRAPIDSGLAAWASCSDVTFWGDSSLPGNSPLGDWAFGLYKAECLPNQALTGISKDGGAPHAHRALCAENGADYMSSNQCYTISFSLGSFQGTFDGDFPGGDWDPDYFKGECGPSEYVAGVAQETHPIVRNGTSYPSQLDTILCCPAVRGQSGDQGAITHSACDVETFHDGNSTHYADPDWDLGFDKGQCAPGKYVAGVSAGSFIAGTDPGAPHALLCCAP